MDLQIKNCPFCDSEAVLKVTEDNSDYCFDRKTCKQIEYYDVKCTNGDCYLCDGADWNHTDKDEIIEIWNTRNKSIERQNKLKDLGI
jgi:hypothetical protein